MLIYLYKHSFIYLYICMFICSLICFVLIFNEISLLKPDAGDQGFIQIFFFAFLQNTLHFLFSIAFKRDFDNGK